MKPIEACAVLDTRHTLSATACFLLRWSFYLTDALYLT